ncbi:hypothetical protein [Amycolatopsis sp. cmx-11-12]|uniref:hypothetical protein n=1 Tax=Amycolatopsis sp. cmx-11-12 TaxID=2785795 RepID=UPI0039185840
MATAEEHQRWCAYRDVKCFDGAEHDEVVACLHRPFDPAVEPGLVVAQQVDAEPPGGLDVGPGRGEVNELTDIPDGRPARSAVTTTIPVGKWPSTSRKVSEVTSTHPASPAPATTFASMRDVFVPRFTSALYEHRALALCRLRKSQSAGSSSGSFTIPFEKPETKPPGTSRDHRGSALSMVCPIQNHWGYRILYGALRSSVDRSI